jgi:nucleoprotein TPR
MVQNTQQSLTELLESRVKSTDEGTVEDVSKLREQLTRKEAEVEDLKAQAAVNSSVASAALEDGAKPLAEQIKEQVDVIRSELEANHKTRLGELEAQYQTRADRMKSHLNKTLAEKRETWRNEGREARQQELEAQHVEALEKLRNDYTSEISKLNQEYEAQLKKLKEDEEIRFKQEKAIWMAEQGTQGAGAQGFDPSKITDDQAKNLVSENRFIKMVVMTNIKKKVTEEKEALTKQCNEEKKELTAKLTEELTTRLNEEHEKAKASALSMQEKKTSVQLSMAANNRAKLTLVEKAAKETPEKPVGEVWEIAKSAKAPPPAAATSVASTAPQPAGPPTSTQATQLPQAPRPISDTGNQSSGQVQTAPRGNFGAQTPIAAPLQRKDSTSSASPVQGKGPQPNPGTASPRRESGPQQTGTQPQNQPNLPIKPLQGQSNIAQPASRGGPQSQVPRGGGIPRGRGGLPTPSTQGHQQPPAQQEANAVFQNALRGRGGARGGRGGQGRGGIPQPQGSGLNPKAAQFQYNPGGQNNNNKRPREDGQDVADGGNMGKRPRGGGPN